jgi:predicted NAD/FAD-binding protein
VLGAFTYSHNDVVLHRDPSVLPEAPDCNASWNYRMDACAGRQDRATVSYWMNRLQVLGFDETFRRLWEFYLAK